VVSKVSNSVSCHQIEAWAQALSRSRISEKEITEQLLQKYAQSCIYLPSMNIGIFGASGYSGAELIRLLRHHPEASLVFLTSDKLVGQHEPESGLRFVSHADAVRDLRQADVVFLCVPPEASLELVPQLLKRTRIIDLSNAFRPKGGATPLGLSASQVGYGLYPFSRFEPGVELVANPGCYATAVTLAVAPFFCKGLVEADVISDASSGISGAGKRASEAYSFTELAEDMSVYKLFEHAHVAEIRTTLERATRERADAVNDELSRVELTFTPRLVPIRRGILATSYARLCDDVRLPQVRSVLSEVYADDPFVRIVERAEDVRPRLTVGTNRVLISAHVNESSRRLIVVSAIDNLVKGAAGQAIENMNLLFAQPRALGLNHPRPLA
jgi:N-acetyl-gamma-glutamyl-phosphate reductase